MTRDDERDTLPPEADAGRPAQIEDTIRKVVRAENGAQTKRQLGALLVGLVVIGGVVMWGQRDTSAQIDALRRELGSTRGDLERRLDAVERDASDTRARLERLERTNP